MDKQKLPEELDLTAEKDFRLSDEFVNSMNEFLCDKFGRCPDGFGVEIKLFLDWGDDNER